MIYENIKVGYKQVTAVLLYLNAVSLCVTAVLGLLSVGLERVTVLRKHVNIVLGM